MSYLEMWEQRCEALQNEFEFIKQEITELLNKDSGKTKEINILVKENRELKAELDATKVAHLRQYKQLMEVCTTADRATGINVDNGDQREPGAVGAVKLLIAKFREATRARDAFYELLEDREKKLADITKERDTLITSGRIDNLVKWERENNQLKRFVKGFAHRMIDGKPCFCATYDPNFSHFVYCDDMRKFF